MDQQTAPIELIVRPLIEQCRREIAAAWAYLDAARAMLARSRGLTELWAEQRRTAQANEETRLSAADRSEAARIGMFVGIGFKKQHASPTSVMPCARADRHSRRRSASG
jgi:hypothetical protein